MVLIFVYFFKLCIKYWNKNTKKDWLNIRNENTLSVRKLFTTCLDVSITQGCFCLNYSDGFGAVFDPCVLTKLLTECLRHMTKCRQDKKISRAGPGRNRRLLQFLLQLGKRLMMMLSLSSWKLPNAECLFPKPSLTISISLNLTQKASWLTL